MWPTQASEALALQSPLPIRVSQGLFTVLSSSQLPTSRIDISALFPAVGSLPLQRILRLSKRCNPTLIINYPNNFMRHLSKSKILAYRQCPKRLWLEIYRPELRDDSSAMAAFKIGHEVGDATRFIYDEAGKGKACQESLILMPRGQLRI